MRKELWRNLGRHKASECTQTCWLKHASVGTALYLSVFLHAGCGLAAHTSSACLVPQADQLHQHAHALLSSAQASFTLPGLGCSSVSQQDRSKGCSWFSASLMSGSRKGLSKARAGSVAAGGRWGALVLKEGRWGSRDAFAWLSWPGKHRASTR